MNPRQLLDDITEAARGGAVTKHDLLSAFERGRKETGGMGSAVNIGTILSYIGGAVVFMGIAVLVSQNWETLPVIARVIVTFGSGLAAYFSGLAFGRDRRTERVSGALFFLSAILLPLGLAVMFDQAGYQTTSGVHATISGLLTAMFLASFLSMRKDVFLLFTILLATWFYFAIQSYLARDIAFSEEWRFHAYQTLLAGLSYVLLGYAFSRSDLRRFSGFLYGFGVFGFLAAALALGGWTPDQSILWEVAFPGIVFGVIFLSIALRAKSFLVFGSIFLMADILKLTSEYFTQGLGWPVSLVIAGFALMGIGYASLYLNRKYLKSDEL